MPANSCMGTVAATSLASPVTHASFSAKERKSARSATLGQRTRRRGAGGASVAVTAMAASPGVRQGIGFTRRPPRWRLIVSGERRPASGWLVGSLIRPALLFGHGWLALGDALQIFANGGRGGVSMRRVRREEFGDHRLQRAGALGRRFRRSPRSDPLLQAPRVVGAKRRPARDHLVQEHAQRPRVRLAIALAGLQALRREVRRAAEVVARDLSAERQRLRRAEVQHLDAIAGDQPDVGRLEIVVQQRRARDWPSAPAPR